MQAAVSSHRRTANKKNSKNEIFIGFEEIRSSEFASRIHQEAVKHCLYSAHAVISK